MEAALQDRQSGISRACSPFSNSLIVKACAVVSGRFRYPRASISPPTNSSPVVPASTWVASIVEDVDVFRVDWWSNCAVVRLAVDHVCDISAGNLMCLASAVDVEQSAFGKGLHCSSRQICRDDLGR